jgi:hypothetical protein
MKKLLGLVLGMFLTVSTFANGGVTYNDVSTAEKSKTEGVFNFSFDSGFSIDDINKTAKYYTNYFTVTPVKTENGINVTIKLVEDNEMARRVVNRFFVSLEVKEINVNGTMIPVEKFVTKYVMK